MRSVQSLLNLNLNLDLGLVYSMRMWWRYMRASTHCRISFGRIWWLGGRSTMRPWSACASPATD